HGPDTTPSTSKAVFFNGTLHPTPDLSLTGGLRYSHDRKEYTYNRFNPDGSIPQPCTGLPFGADQPPNCTLAGMQDREIVFVSERWDWRLVADYRFSDALLAYGSVATGYKGGGVNPYPYFQEQIQPF